MMPGSPLEVREGIKRTKTTTLANIKNIEGECKKLCEEKVQVWKEFIQYLDMKAVEVKLIEAHKQVQQVEEMAATLPPIAHMSSILAQRHA
jgi:hypothetical protein